ncbi:hypothetical protein MKJ04_15750 [Pontibacter sp. E15-1]|uniref:toxin-antitoxin system YwqK family antitoxin n=1 Tax=Pontibacter sp. E15-1 TaxID=2919918 RepID=UPI001F4F7A6B|nr:hypothetical protein [Pontibacter sp. E15-1]MCJ8166302.1 hypothetical protein [Pontibacter sp. E15-1]
MTTQPRHIPTGVLLICLTVSALFLAPFKTLAQPTDRSTQAKARQGVWPFRINRLDADGRFHGRWKVWGPEGRGILRKGRFRHGKEVGTWRYYYPGGTLYLVEKHHRKSGLLRVRRYHENGALAKEGQAATVTEGGIIRYYWFGSWRVYDETGAYSHAEYYIDGKLLEIRR